MAPGEGTTEKEKTEYIDSDGKKYLKTSYIESTGTQYIDTGFTAEKNVSHKFVIDFQLSNLIGTQQTIMGHDLNDIKINSNGYMQGNTSYPYIGLDRRVVTVEYIPTNNGNNHFITMDTDDNQHAERNSTYWPSPSNVTLFTNSKSISERMASGRIYSAKIYNNDILVLAKEENVCILLNKLVLNGRKMTSSTSIRIKTATIVLALTMTSSQTISLLLVTKNIKNSYHQNMRK